MQKAVHRNVMKLIAKCIMFVDLLNTFDSKAEYSPIVMLTVTGENSGKS